MLIFCRRAPVVKLVIGRERRQHAKQRAQFLHDLLTHGLVEDADDLCVHKVH